MRFKTTAMLAMLLASFLFIACNDKADSEEQQTTNVQTSTTASADSASGADHLRMYFEGLHPDDQRKLFSGLPGEMKHALWLSHLRASKRTAKNDQERNFIQQMIDRLKPAYYSDTTLYRKEAGTYFTDQSSKLFSVFGNDSTRAINMMYRIGGDPKGAKVLEDGGLPDCICNIKKDWCWWGYKCKTGDCKKSLVGCGPFGLEQCDGSCFANEE